MTSKKYSLISMRVGFEGYDITRDDVNNTIKTIVEKNKSIELVIDTNKKKDQKKRTYVWKFADYTTYDNGRYIIGTLGRTKNHLKLKDYSENYGKFLDREINLRNTDLTSRFLYDTESQIIVFEHKSNIPYTTFTEIFCSIYCQEDKGRLLFSRCNIIESTDIFRVISQWTTISKVKFDVHQTNPENYPAFQGIDEDIRKTNAKNFKATIHAKKNETLNVDPGTIAYMGLALGEAGYGEYTVTGEQNGEPKTEKKSNKMSFTMEVPDSTIDSFAKKIIEYITSYLNKNRPERKE